jgi:allantoicase
MTSKPPKFTELNDLTCQEIGGKILFATDDWFAGLLFAIINSKQILCIDTKSVHKIFRT